MRLKVILCTLMLFVVSCFSGMSMAKVTTSASDEVNIFNDVDENHWAYDYIKLMSDNGIISGYNDGSFKPNGIVTREEFAKMMVLTLGLELINPDRDSFVDVKSSDWSYKYVETAKLYLTGFRTSQGDFFKPKNIAVREDMAVAIVKGLELSTENVNLSILNSLDDEDKISNNLKPYVAIAMNEGIMVGDNNKFNPQENLTRAEAATLLARLIIEEKVTYDEEKITYEEGNNIKTSTPTLDYELKNNSVLLNWTSVNKENFKYYKIVLSKYDSTPQYPNNGYLVCITDISNNSYELENGQYYNEGDLSKIKSGEEYYVSITAVYNNKKESSNVIKVKIPNNEVNYSEENRTPQLTYKKVNEGMLLNWTTTSSDNFKYYKIVLSKYNNSPAYPKDGYLTYISSSKEDSYLIKVGQKYNGGDIGDKIVGNQAYYISITAVYRNGDNYYTSNVIKTTIK